MKKIFYNTGLSFGGFIIALILVEVIVRILGLAQQTNSFYESDPFIGVRHIPYQHGEWQKKEFKADVSFNADGFRDIDHQVAKPAGIRRIVVLGDSYVEALQVPLNNTFYKSLERKLNFSGKKTEVINFGVSGFGIPQDYLALKHYGLKYGPDLVILMVTTGNDIRNSHPDLELDPSKPYFELNREGKLKLKPVIVPESNPSITDYIKGAYYKFFPQSYIFVYQTLVPRWQMKANEERKAVQPDIPLDHYVYTVNYTPVWKEAWTVTLALIKQMKCDLDARGIPLLVVAITDNNAQIDGSLQKVLEQKGPEIKWDMDKPVKMLSSFCRSNQISFLPLIDGFRKEYQSAGGKFHFMYDGHWNTRSHELGATLLYNRITKYGLLQ